MARRARRHGGRGQTEQGAAAVEFALLVPLLFAILFGIIDYGLWFSDSIGLRSGVREGARAGVVGQWGSASSCGRLSGASPNIRRLACQTADLMPAAPDELALRIRVLTAGGSDTADWAVGGRLRVCAMQRQDGATGLVPLPDGGIITARVDMAIERVQLGQRERGGADPALPGSDWSWC